MNVRLWGCAKKYIPVLTQRVACLITIVVWLTRRVPQIIQELRQIQASMFTWLSPTFVTPKFDIDLIGILYIPLCHHPRPRFSLCKSRTQRSSDKSLAGET
jgi:hypothetical protein